MTREPIDVSTLLDDERLCADLRQRLARTRWPDKETVDDWSQGVPLARLRALADYWRDRHDWRATEARLNALEPSSTTIDGLDIHFLHIRSPEPGALLGNTRFGDWLDSHTRGPLPLVHLPLP